MLAKVFLFVLLICHQTVSFWQLFSQRPLQHTRKRLKTNANDSNILTNTFKIAKKSYLLKIKLIFMTCK